MDGFFQHHANSHPSWVCRFGGVTVTGGVRDSYRGGRDSYRGGVIVKQGGQPAALGRVMSYLPAANSVTVQPSATSSGNASRTRWRRLRMVEPLASDGQT
jgi:hypothetical protein